MLGKRYTTVPDFKSNVRKLLISRMAIIETAKSLIASFVHYQLSPESSI